MNLNELESLRECNEIDLLNKLVTIANGVKRRTEEAVRGTKQAGVDVRKKMQEIKMLTEIIRDDVQVRKGLKKNRSVLEDFISAEKKRIKKEEEKIKRLKEKREAQIRENGK